MSNNYEYFILNQIKTFETNKKIQYSKPNGHKPLIFEQN